jgi:hypothetical protein
MKIFTKALLLVVALVTCTQLFAQRRHYGRNYYYDRHSYRYYYRPSYRPSVSIIARVPFGAVGVTFGSRYYHYYGGRYYQPMRGGYGIVPPPVGIVVPVLPPNCVHVMIGGRPYYRYDGVYYMPRDNDRYEVVDEPADSDSQDEEITDNSSDGGYEKIVLEGKTYYKKGSKYYKARVTDDGEVMYEEVGENIK